MAGFELRSDFKPCGDQPAAIEELSASILKGRRYQTLLGVTGSGKTFTLANVIQKVQKPTLVISHNKTLAAQLYEEFKEFFPRNAVEYFVSYYDYYQPEAYIPSTDTYIEKDASINDRLDRLRLSSTSSLMSRSDVIIVASVSCIYNLGSPEDYRDETLILQKGGPGDRQEISRKLVSLQYERNDYEFVRGKFRVRGDNLEVYPSYEQKALRVQMFGDTVEAIAWIDPLTGKVLEELDKATVFAAKHFIVGEKKIASALREIEQEMHLRLAQLRGQNKLVEAQRLESRTRYDMEMLSELGYCPGIENYSRILSGNPPGARPYCLMDYFPRDFLVVIDESHVTLPQIRGMYAGDRARKEVLVEYGFRLPSCLDNRPLRYEEFNDLVRQAVFVSATPNDYEVKLAGGKVVEQIIRPTGLVDPQIEVRKSQGQMDDLVEEVRKRAAKNERTLITTLTKRMAEDLTNYLQERGLKVQYLHSEVETFDRTRILKELREKKHDCVVGVNLLREGLDLPEVSLVAILDADKEGYLRSTTSLIQVAGRAARNINGLVIMYADSVTGSMERAISESSRRRKAQLEYNARNGITPHTVQKAIKEGLEVWAKAEQYVYELTGEKRDEYEERSYVAELEYEMELAARNLQFEKAAAIRDKIREFKDRKK